VGGLAAPGAPLLTLEDQRRYWLEATVPESQVSGLKRGQSLRVTIETAGVSGAAQVSEILPAADPATRTITVRLDLPARSPEAGLPDAPAIAQGEAILTETELRARDRANLLVALEQATWRIHGPGGAAQLLGLKPTTLLSRMKKLGLKKPLVV